MRIAGLGIDLVEVSRVGRLLERHPGFAERCFTEGERDYAFRFARPERRLAARFAGKEAVMKSLGTGWRGIRWKDVEITGGGAPRALLRGTALARAEALGVAEVLVSVTHTDEAAVVMAVAVCHAPPLKGEVAPSPRGAGGGASSTPPPRGLPFPH